MEYKSLHVRLLVEDYDWLDRHSFETKLSKAEIIRQGLELYRRKARVMPFSNLQDLTDRESGIVAYHERAILCNWTGIDGFPRLSQTGGIGGLGEDIPNVAGEHVDDLAPYLEYLDIYIAVSDYSKDDYPIAGGTIYDLGDDILVITPDGWI